MEFECENMTMLGCGARDSAKELILQELIEDGTMGIEDLCKEQCCLDCNKSCGYRCGRTYEKEKSEDLRDKFKQEEIGQVSYKQLSFF